jgi:23S rRNA (uracil1939-C5)-methyltransferase
MDQRVVAELERRSPRRIVYISCDPATLARDLTRMPSFRLVTAVAFDLFPQTAHVETVALLDRAS